MTALDLDAIKARYRLTGAYNLWASRQDVPALVAEVERLRTKLAVIRGIGANSGTDLNAWNKAFDVIEAALRGPSDSSSTGTEL